ncbi:MAG: lipopolysaccharide heptosyltransferase II [Pseudomonadota bacterium]|nr:lipopolysaccharide heptosyltransferase II [Pseudomonadota bacterium]
MSEPHYLVIAPAWVGDMVMMQPLLTLLKQQPCRITVLASPWGEGLLKRMPEVDAVLNLPFAHGDFQPLARWQFGRSLRHLRFTHAIVLPNSWKSALIPLAAKIPVRTSWRGEFRYGLLNDIRILEKARYPLMIERFLALGLPPDAPLPKPQWPKLQMTADAVNAAVTKHGLTLTAPILALCPGAEFGPAKRWPTEHFGAVARDKIAEGWQVWLMGSAKEKPLAAEIQAHSHDQCIDLTGKTSLAEVIDLLSVAKVVVCNDTGLMHIAAAVARPLVAVYGSSSPKFTPPLATHVDVATLNKSCSPCFARTCQFGHYACLQELTPKRVLSGIERLCGS